MGRLVSMLVLVGVLGGLGAYIYFVESKRPASGIEEKEKVFTVEADKIEEITLRAEGETSTLRKVDGSWKMVAPIQADADQSAVSSLTSTLSSLEVNRVVDENAANLAEYGLENPRIAITFKAPGGTEGQLHLGEKTATQSDVYGLRPGTKRVFLIPAFNESTFAKKSFDLRDKRILNFERDQVDSIELAQAKSTVQLARTGSEWVVKQPVQARGDYGAIEGLLTRLSSASMTKLVAPSVSDPTELAKYGLDKPQARATLGAGSTRATLAIGKEEEGAVYGQDQARGMVFALDPTLATELKKTADDFRDKDLFEFRSFNAARVRIVRGSDTYEFEKVTTTGENAGEKWQRITGNSRTDVDGPKMDDLLTKLVGLRAESFVPTSDATAKPSLVVSASYDGGKFERVRLAKTGNDVFASREGEAGAAKLAATNYDETIKALDAVVAPATATTSTPAKP